MTLREQLNEILEKHNHNLCMLPGHPNEATISAIIDAFTERLPGEFVEPPKRYSEQCFDNGWNAYRQEVLKVLGEK